ncbi:MAG: hypothetical protein ACTS22_00425 [Phycisphaerales bacterium]
MHTPHRLRRLIHHSRPVACAAGALLLAAPLAGCLEDDELGRAIDSVSSSLSALAVEGSAVPGEQMRTSTYEEAIRTLRPLVSEGTQAQQAAAHLLIARAEFGLSSGPAARVAAVSRDARALISEVNAERGKLLTLESVASAVGSFDASDEIAELRQRIQDRIRSVETEQQRLAQVEASVTELDNQADAADEEAQQIRVQESTLRDRALALPATEALPIFEQAAELRVQADTLAADAERLRAQADVIRPQIGEVQAEISRLTEQRRLAEESIESLNAEAEASRREAQSITSQAAEVRSAIQQKASELAGLVEAQLAPAFDAAVESFDAAASSARRATSGERTAARLVLGEVEQAKAGLAASYAELLDAAVATLDAAGLAAESSSMRDRAEAARTLASEAIAEARTNFESAGVRGDAADRLDSVIARLGGGEAEPETQTETENSPADAEDTAPADQG